MLVIIALILVVIAGVTGVLGFAGGGRSTGLCLTALLTGIIGALIWANASRARQRQLEDARTQAIVDAVRRGDEPGKAA